MLYNELVSREIIEKGWSGDAKYRGVDGNGRSYLLRIADWSMLERKRIEYEYMSRVAALGVAMCAPLETGECGEGVYSLHTWIDGADAEEVVPGLPEKEQYRLGAEAGAMLRLIHSIPASPNTENWSLRFNRKLDRKIDMYDGCLLKYEKGQLFLDCIEANRGLLTDRPQTFQHGDYHIGNMMVDKEGRLYVIDFDRFDFGDPWEEFNRIAFSARCAPRFAAGIVDGYFPEGVPMEFWKLLTLYLSSNTLSSLPWAIPYGEEQISFMRKQAEEILVWYDDMQTVIPSWYRAGEKRTEGE